MSKIFVGSGIGEIKYFEKIQAERKFQYLKIIGIKECTFFFFKYLLKIKLPITEIITITFTLV